MQAVRGGVVGALAGALVLGLEEAVAAAFALPPLAVGDVAVLLLDYAAVGALAGAILAAAGLRGARLGLALWALGAGALLAGKLVAWGQGIGASWVLGLGGCAAVAALASRLPERWGAGAAVGLAWTATVGFAVNLNAFGSPVEAPALVADAVIVAIGLGLALGTGWLRPEPRVGLAIVAGLWLGWPVLAWLRAAPASEGAGEGPVVVLVVVDTLRADRLGFMGYGGDTSPVLDELANRGLVYERAQAGSPWTLPSFATLLTGRIVSEHGAGVNPGGGNTESALGDVVTVPEELAAEGLATGAVVSNPFLRRAYGLDRGFGHYDDALGVGHLPLIVQPLAPFGLAPLRARHYRPAAEMSDAAIGWVEAQDEGGFFVMVHFMDPHLPYQPRAQDVRGTGRDALYDAEIRGVDAALGELLAALPDDAWVIVTADHGEELDDHAGAYPGEAIPDRAWHGHTQYQELLHVPLVVVGPGVSPGRVDRPVSHVEVAGALRRMAGLDGEGLPEVFGETGEIAPAVSESILFGRERKAVRVGDWKLVAGPSVELYDLAADPGERRDLADRYPGRVEALSALLPVDGASGPTVDREEAVRAALHALGYGER